ncbi:tripartite tricarboxylate transporter substrate binding protein [Boseaceae bacterium BT-24-1]|nr:tripartite tricarboxylate transporter substrate binding protein [Boseaceae bacterium BT-24-1]
MSVGLAFLANGSASAQSGYPSRNLTIIVAVAPGSPTDVFARLIAGELQTRLGKPVVVENRPGGGQVIGAGAAARAEPDGHTLFHGNVSGLIISPQLREPPTYTTPKDFRAITATFSGPQALIVDPSLPIKDAKELIAYAKANPGKLNYGSYGIGSLNHVTTELFKGIAGIDMVHIPYGGGSTLTTAMLTGDVQVMILDLGNVGPLVEAGKARIIAQVGDRRSTQFPDIPLLSETVDPALAADLWLGMVAPAATPPAVLSRLNKEITEILNLPLLKSRGEAASMSPVPMSTQDFDQKLAKEWERWGKVLKEHDIKLR